MLLDMVKVIIAELVDDPEEVDIQMTEGAHTNIIEVRVAYRDIGKVIGKQGRTAEALRTIVGCASAKYNKKHILEIVDGKERPINS